MAYRCVHCGEIYDDTSQEVIGGCGKCKSRFFFYIKEEKLREITEGRAKSQDEIPELTASEKMQVEADVREIVGIEDDETPVFLDFESIKILKPGKYVLDLSKLFARDQPRVYQLEDGKYIIDLTTKIVK